MKTIKWILEETALAVSGSAAAYALACPCAYRAAEAFGWFAGAAVAVAGMLAGSLAAYLAVNRAFDRFEKGGAE